MSKSTACVRPQLANYIFTDRLGNGTYATVYKAFRKSSTMREVVAVKCVDKSSLNRTSTENLLTEIELLKTLRHEHIVELRDFQWDDHYIYLIMEYCGGGDLFKFIQARRVLPESVAKLVVQQLALPVKMWQDFKLFLQYMRSMNVSHMDLKPQNILLSSDESPRLKIADFGFAHYLVGDTEAANNLRGSLLYMAPEILTRQQYNEKADLWSVGVILFECLFGHAPFASKTRQELEDRIYDTTPVKIPCSVHISSKCHDLLARLLQRDPERRISYDEFLNHPFVDFEHRPSADALNKARDLVAVAIEKDSNGETQQAISFYCQAISYFIPAIHYEQDHRKKNALREKVQQYVSRAEALKVSMKPKATSSSSSSSTHSPSSRSISQFEELVKLSASDGDMMNALQIIQTAQKKELSEDYEASLEKYESALDVLLRILQSEPKGRRKELLQSMISMWISRAEEIKKYVSVKDLPASDVKKTEEETSLYDLTSCSIQ